MAERLVITRSSWRWKPMHWQTDAYSYLWLGGVWIRWPKHMVEWLRALRKESQ